MPIPKLYYPGYRARLWKTVTAIPADQADLLTPGGILIESLISATDECRREVHQLNEADSQAVRLLEEQFGDDPPELAQRVVNHRLSTIVRNLAANEKADHACSHAWAIFFQHRAKYYPDQAEAMRELYSQYLVMGSAVGFEIRLRCEAIAHNSGVPISDLDAIGDRISAVFSWAEGRIVELTEIFFDARSRISGNDPFMVALAEAYQRSLIWFPTDAEIGEPVRQFLENQRRDVSGLIGELNEGITRLRGLIGDPFFAETQYQVLGRIIRAFYAAWDKLPHPIFADMEVMRDYFARLEAARDLVRPLGVAAEDVNDENDPRYKAAALNAAFALFEEFCQQAFFPEDLIEALQGTWPFVNEEALP